MPVDLTLTDSYLHVRMHGVVTAQEFDRYGEESAAIEAQQPMSLDRITDLTAVEQFQLRYDDVFRLAEHRKHQTYSRAVKSAIVANARVQIGMARMFETIGDSPWIEYRVVRTLNEALEWIVVVPTSAAVH